MKQTLNNGVPTPTPTANLAINKSRIKLYGKNSQVPTYYLNKGQEFQIELFNPTKDTILAKISLNSKPIAQGGLVIRPGERVFLDRYIDVARKFKFDTYEVANTSEAKKAIEDNGDFKVEFFKEYTPMTLTVNNSWNNDNGLYFGDPIGAIGVTNVGGQVYGATSTGNAKSANLGVTNTNYHHNVAGSGISLQDDGIATLGLASISASAGEATLDSMEQEVKRPHLMIPKENVTHTPIKKSKRRLAKKSVETGRVEMGSVSEQKMTTVDMNWEVFPFHTLEYKMIPLSQKVNTVEDTQVKRYCSNCGNKQKPAFKFCPSCGERA